MDKQMDSYLNSGVFVQIIYMKTSQLVDYTISKRIFLCTTTWTIMRSKALNHAVGQYHLLKCIIHCYQLKYMILL